MRFRIETFKTAIHISTIPIPIPQCINGTVEADNGACNGPPTLSYTGAGPTGSVVLRYALKTYMLNGDCSAQCSLSGQSPAGADGIICTADDPAAGPAESQSVVLTSGTAFGRVLHANNDAAPLEGSATGHVANCATLAGPNGLQGMATVEIIRGVNTALNGCPT